MESKTNQAELLNVLVVGNNPIELSKTFESLGQIKHHTVVTEIAFDLVSIIERLGRFKPHYILIDDNLGKIELKLAVSTLLGNRKTKHIPITVLKNSNYQEALNTGVMNYILKDSITAESLYTALINSLKFKKTQLYLQQAYRKRRGKLFLALRSMS
ncbi:MAG: response regulator [Cyclobacteriaceae bacterium]|nr:response regulator [Cyclobacteriaceae bacterium]